MKKIILLFTIFLVFFSCSKLNNTITPHRTTGYSIFFEIEPVKNKKNLFKALYIKNKVKGGFLFSLNLKKRDSKGIAFTHIIFKPLKGSQNSYLIKDLSDILQNKNKPGKTITVKELKKVCAIMGSNLTRESGNHTIAGTFTSDKKGNWHAMKIFLGDEYKEAEIYFNINVSQGIGEISTKDSEYGNKAMKELLKIL